MSARLSDQQIALIQTWAANGAPEGNPADLPPLPKFTQGWAMGQPDIVVKMPEPFTVRAERPDVFRCFVVPLSIPEGKYVKAVEYRPANRKVTHHSLLFLDNTGEARRLDEADPGPTPPGWRGAFRHRAGWAAGRHAPPHHFPDGAAKAIAKNTDLVIQIHFHPSGKVETEQSSVGIYLTDQAPTRTLTTIPLGVRSNIDIPPGVKDYVWKDNITVPVDFEIPAITPHAHYICTKMDVGRRCPPARRNRSSASTTGISIGRGSTATKRR